MAIEGRFQASQLPAPADEPILEWEVLLPGELREVRRWAGDDVAASVAHHKGRRCRKGASVDERILQRLVEAVAADELAETEFGHRRVTHNSRQLQNLALIVPGVSAGWNLSTAANRYGKARENTEGAFNVNGARSRSNDFLLDGMPMLVRQYSVINFEPSNEAVQEFTISMLFSSGRPLGSERLEKSMLLNRNGRGHLKPLNLSGFP